ncbi:MAG: filamentous hemagglutinin N-terminal domain-containing protein, partial [Acidovorax sp.]|uniref:two-partner secretion domain-containing protein n=1 Tax=Acidovorax sp. TaxID=1872122 RepID=UPI0039E37F86
MNKHLHRVIFNPSRGMRMVVQESAASAAKARGGSAGETTQASAALMPLALAAALLLTTQGSFAQIIANPSAPSQQRPTVLNSANGTPTINIQTPSASGVSRNAYQQFDIGQRGAILNNSRSDATTQLGGWVQGNPWLAGGSARVIVNEVNSAAQSRLMGPLEVAGQRADVVIANPSGLIVDGLSLINAAGVTLTTGHPLYGANGSLNGFSVQAGTIHVQGSGMDATQADYASILARAISVNAGLWAQDLRMATGVNQTDAAASILQSTAAPTGGKPQFALDVAHLGGMYAGKIFIVGTEAGLGVRNAGTVSATSGPLTLTVDGQLSNSGAIAANHADADLRIAAQGMDNSGTLGSQRDITLQDGGVGIANAGTIQAARQLLVQSGQLGNQASGSITAQRLDIAATGLSNAGSITQTGLQNLTLHSATLSNADTAATLGAPPATTGASGTSAGTGTSGSSVSGSGATAPPSSGQDGSALQTTPTTPVLLADGRIQVTGTIANVGQLIANGATDVSVSQALRNSGTANIRQLHIEGALDNSGGTLTARDFSGTQTALHNRSGTLVVQTDLHLAAQELDNTAGTIGSAQSLAVHVQGGAINHAGTLAAGRELTIQAQSLDNTQGEIAQNGPGQMQIDVSSALQNQQAIISSSGSARIQVARLDNGSGTISALQQLDITAAQGMGNMAGTLQAGADLHVATVQIDNRTGAIMAHGAASVTSLDLDNTQGRIGASTVHIDTQGRQLTNTEGQILASSGGLHLQAGALDNQRGRIAALHSATLAANGIGNDGGRITAATLHIRSQDGAGHWSAVSNQGGAILADQRLQLDSAALNNAAGAIQTTASDSELLIDSHGGDITNRQSGSAGGILSSGALQIEAQGGRIDNGQDGYIGAAGSAQLSGGTIANQGSIVGGGSVAISASQTLTNRGLIDGRHTRIDAGAIDNVGTGQIHGDRISIRAGILDNRTENGISATIASRGDLDIGAATVNNQGGATLLSLGDMRLGGTLDADGSATGQAQAIHNTGSRIDAAGGITLAAAAVNNTNAGIEIARQELVAIQAAQTLVQLPGQQPESASQYREVWDGVFIPYLYGDSAWSASNGMPGGASDGRIFKPAHPDKFLSTLPLAYQETTHCDNTDSGSGCTTTYTYEPAGSTRFAQYGIEVPPNYDTATPAPETYGAQWTQAQASYYWPAGSDKAAYDAAVKTQQDSIAAAKQLNQAILAVIQQNNRIEASSREYTLIEGVTETIHRDRLISSLPGQITAGASIVVAGALNNIDSTVIAGGSIQAGQLNNRSTATGVETRTTTGTATHYWWEHHGGFSDSQERNASAPQAFNSAQSTTFDLPTVVFLQNQAGAGTGGGNPGSGGAQGPLKPAQSTGTIATATQQPVATTSGEQLYARTAATGAALPASSLYVVNAHNAHRPLVETDPRFADHRQWISSDYMLNALGLDPALQQKRLGDGFYEQQLVQQQIGQLTGRRFLGDYTSNDAQYAALLQSGVTFAQAHGLRPGVALSAAQLAQLAQLTSDLVWLVEQTVTLPDGSQQAVLVPQVYVVARPGDLSPSGALISGETVSIQSEGSAYNSGTI